MKIASLKAYFAGELLCLDKYAREFVKSWFNKALSSKVKEMQDEAFKSFVYCTIFYKDEGFKEENEVRIHAYPNVHDERYLSPERDQLGLIKPEKELKFRNKNGDCVPYIELFAFPSDDSKKELREDLPIKRIIVGPHRNQESRVSALKLKLRGRGIDVTSSKIPYRE